MPSSPTLSSQGEDFHRLPGMVYRSAGGAVSVNGQAYSTFTTPPRFDGLDMERYEKAGFGIGVVTKLGDNFTVTSPASRQSQSWRALRPIEDVISEVRDLKESYGLRKVFFIDSGFNVPLAHAKSLCQGLLDADMGIQLEQLPGACSRLLRPGSGPPHERVRVRVWW